MASFQIFIPGQEFGERALHNAGLGDLATDFDLIQDVGPGNAFGCFYAWRKPNWPHIGYRPEEQEWISSVGVSGMPDAGYYVGFWKHAMPTPSDLQRPYPYSGKFFDLGDGHKWFFPVSTWLPRDIVLADDGSWKFQVQRRFANFTLECIRWTDRLANEEPYTVTDLAEFLVMALSLNYRLTREVVNRLGLFNSTNLKDALLGVLGVQNEEVKSR